MKSLSFGANGKPKLELPKNFLQLLNEGGFKELPLRSEDAAELAKFLQLHNHDPMDRMLLAQASNQGIPLLTADRKILALGLDWVIDSQD